MIPNQGFLGTNQNTNASLLDRLLPEDHLANYTDLVRRGRPTGTTGRVLGSFVVELTVPNNRFFVTIRQRGCHGTALVDRVF